MKKKVFLILLSLMLIGSAIPGITQTNATAAAMVGCPYCHVIRPAQSTCCLEMRCETFTASDKLTQSASTIQQIAGKISNPPPSETINGGAYLKGEFIAEIIPLELFTYLDYSDYFTAPGSTVYGNSVDQPAEFFYSGKEYAFYLYLSEDYWDFMPHDIRTGQDNVNYRQKTFDVLLIDYTYSRDDTLNYDDSVRVYSEFNRLEVFPLTAFRLIYTEDDGEYIEPYRIPWLYRLPYAVSNINYEFSVENSPLTTNCAVDDQSNKPTNHSHANIGDAGYLASGDYGARIDSVTRNSNGYSFAQREYTNPVGDFMLTTANYVGGFLLDAVSSLAPPVQIVNYLLGAAEYLYEVFGDDSDMKSNYVSGDNGNALILSSGSTQLAELRAKGLSEEELFYVKAVTIQDNQDHYYQFREAESKAPYAVLQLHTTTEATLLSWNVTYNILNPNLKRVGVNATKPTTAGWIDSRTVYDVKAEIKNKPTIGTCDHVFQYMTGPGGHMYKVCQKCGWGR